MRFTAQNMVWRGSVGSSLQGADPVMVITEPLGYIHYASDSVAMKKRSGSSSKLPAMEVHIVRARDIEGKRVS
jgi:hypothetical protein